MIELKFKKESSKLISKILGEIQIQTQKSWENFIMMKPTTIADEKELEQRIEKFSTGETTTRRDLELIHNGFQNPNLDIEVMSNLIILLDEKVPAFDKTKETDYFVIHYTTQSKNKLDNITNIKRVEELGEALDSHYNAYDDEYKRPPYNSNKGKKIEVLLFKLTDLPNIPKNTVGFTTPKGPICFDSVIIQEDSIYYKTVSAHELFHRVQFAFGFEVDWAHINIGFFAEGTASWAEIWRNDGMIGASYKITDAFENVHKDLLNENYDSVVFWMMFQKQYGNDNLKSYLTKCEELKDPIKALDEICRNNASKEEFKSFKGACLLYYSLLNNKFYPNAWKVGYDEITDRFGNTIKPEIKFQKVINSYEGKVGSYAVQYLAIALPSNNTFSIECRVIIKTKSFKNTIGYYSPILSFGSVHYNLTTIPNYAHEQDEDFYFELDQSKNFYVLEHIFDLSSPYVHVIGNGLIIIGIVGAPSQLTLCDEEYKFGISYDINYKELESHKTPAICLKDDILFMSSVAENGNLNILHSYDGINWGQLNLLKNQYSSYAPAIASYNGDLIMAYVGHSPKNRIYLSKGRYDYNNVLKWDIKQLKRHKSIHAPALCEFKDKLFMAYVGESPENGMYISMSNDGLEWDNTRSLKRHKSIHAPSLCLFKEKLFMAYVGESPKNCVYISMSDDGLDWDTTRRLERHKSIHSPTLCEHNGDLYMAYVGEWPKNGIYVSKSGDGMEWNITRKIKNHKAVSAPVLYTVQGVLFIAYVGEWPKNKVYRFELAKILEQDFFEEKTKVSIQAALMCDDNRRIYFFKGNKYVRQTIYSGEIDSGYPRLIKGNWPDLPDSFNEGIDAALMCKYNNKIYFFKDDKYARYSVENVTKIDSGYPKPIKGNWQGLPDSFTKGIDAAIWRNDNEKIYFFKGYEYVRFTIFSGKIDPGYPKPIKGNWPDFEWNHTI